MLSESEIQSQLALNAQVVAELHWLCEQVNDDMNFHIKEYKYYAGLNVDKERIKQIKAVHFATISSLKRKISKYAKLQKALKDMLREIRWSKRRSKRVIEILEHIGMWEAGIHFDDSGTEHSKYDSGGFAQTESYSMLYPE